MTTRPVGIGDTEAGAVVTLGLQKQDGREVHVDLRWRPPDWRPSDEEADLHKPQYKEERCAPGLPARTYPGYKLASHGRTYCLYVSSQSKYAPYPLVRFFTFDFGEAFGVEVEYEHLHRALAGLPGTRGVLLDLRDNVGGDDPNWVLDWFSPKPYLDLTTRVVKTAAVAEALQKQVVNLDDGWRRALSRVPDGATVARFIGCTADDCSNTQHKPAHRLLPVRVALLVGPQCLGACDHFARVFDLNGLGPVVGEPTSASLTNLHLDLPVVNAAGRRLGTMGVALSLDYSPFTNQPVEGLPMHVDVPVAWTWALRDTYEKQMIDGALEALSKYAK